MNFFDKYNLIHLNPDPTPTDSENGPLFTAHYFSYLDRSDYSDFGHIVENGNIDAAIESIHRSQDRPAEQWFAPSGNWYKMKDNPPDVITSGEAYTDGLTGWKNGKRNIHFSHDNMTGLYCLYWLRDGKVPPHLPVLRWNDRWWLHPRDICFYSFAHIAHKKGMLWKMLQHVLMLLPTVSMVVSCLRKPTDTSGKCLSYLRFTTFGLKKTGKLCSMILTNKSWFDVFRYYFKHPDHPVPKLVAQLQEIE